MTSVFRQRLYDIAREQGRFSGYIPHLENDKPFRRINELELESLQYCAKHNPKLSDYRLAIGERGLFKILSDKTIVYNGFATSQDPMTSVPWMQVMLGDANV